jgi:hypothetical protein
MIPISYHFIPFRLSADSVKGRPWREVTRYESPQEADDDR